MPPREGGTPLVGVVLAAGRGTRSHPLNCDHPKPLLPVCNKPIIRYQLEALQRAGVDEVIVVLGHFKEQMSRVLTQNGLELGLRIRCLEQQEALGIAHALLQLEAFTDATMLVLLGDIFMVAPRLEEMTRVMEQHHAGAVLAVSREPDPAVLRRNFAVLLRGDGSVGRVVEKPRAVATDLKGSGIYLFRPEIFEALRRTPRTALRDEYEITDSIQLFIDSGHAVYPAEVVGRDVNVTVARDLLECNLHELERRGSPASQGDCGAPGVIVKNSLLGRNVQLAAGTVVETSILGDGVTVEHPILIRESVVFGGARVTDAGAIERAIVTATARLDCR